MGKDLNRTYKDCGLIMFRGPFFRYNVLANNKIILTLDSTTHYIRSEPFLYEIRRRGGLDWFIKEMQRQRKLAEERRRRFVGIHFFYDLQKNDVAIDDVDPRPISEINLPRPLTVNGVECRTIAEYLRAKYLKHPGTSRLDESQPGLRGGTYTYAPQFLHQTVPLQDVPDEILNDQTFLMDRSPPRRRDTQRPAQVRWDMIKKYFHLYNFQYADLGPVQLKMDGPLCFPIANHFNVPKLLVAGGQPVTPEQLESALAGGLFQPPRIDKVFLFSVMDRETNRSFYEAMVGYAKDSYAVDLPKLAIPLERDLRGMRTQLENSIAADGLEGSFCIGIIPGGSDLHADLTNTCGELGLPSKCVTVPVVRSVCLRGVKFYLRDTLASIFTRAGAIPWILHDKLHYGCYVAVDVGRSRSEYWALGIVYDQDGRFTIRQGRITVGEDLDQQSVRYCLTEASRYAHESESLIYLRDGDVFETERQMFERVVEAFPSYSRVAIVSIKGSVPYRILRRLGDEVAKPLSGDYYFLDEYTAVLCAAGGDIYEHGTPKPVVAEVVPIRGDIDVQSVIEDVFRLSYLNWGSPDRSYSVPAPIRLAHQSASELSLGIRRHGAPF